MRVQKIENLNKVLDFLKMKKIQVPKKDFFFNFIYFSSNSLNRPGLYHLMRLRIIWVKLENIGAEDILDRNERLILGLIWTIILRFQIDTIVIDAVRSFKFDSSRSLLKLWSESDSHLNHNPQVEVMQWFKWKDGFFF